MKWNKFEEWFFEQKISTQALVLSILILLVLAIPAIGYMVAGEMGVFIGVIILIFIVVFIFNYIMLSK